MIKLKEWVITKLIIEVTNEWIPYDWEVSFGIYNKKWDIVRQKEVEVEWWVAEITVPKIKENDYRFTLETDEGYSDIQDLIVSKSVRTPTTEVTRKYQIDINNERDEKYEKNIGKNKILMNEFYMNNGKRIKKLESDIEEHKGRMDMDKWEMMECIGKGKEEMKKELEDFSKVIGSKIEWVSRELVSFEKSSEEKTDMIIEDLETFKTDTDEKLNQTKKTINTITETIWDISKKNSENGLSMSEKITRIEKSIPTGWILDYEVDDEGLSTTILRTSDKIDKRIRWEVGRQKKYVSYQNMFDTIVVSWQDSLQPTSPLDELTLVAGTGMTITTDSTTQTVTFASTASWTGDVVWPASSTDNAIARFDWATGKLLQDWLATVSDTGEISTPSNVVAAAFYTSKDNWVAIEWSNTWQGRAFVYATGNDTNIDLELSWQWTGKVKVTDDLHVTGTTKIDTLTAEELVITDASKNLVSASVATYPSLTELTYLKWVTSSIQTQLNAFVNAMIYKGNWDASAWTFPWAWIAQTWRFYTVSVWGTVDSVVFNIWDRLIATVDNASATTFSWNWTQLDATDAVTSVNGMTGNVTGLVPYTWATADLNLWIYDAITDTLRASTSAWLLMESANGTDVWLLWAWNTANIAWYWNHNYSTATQDTIAIFTGAWKTLWSAATATYPSLTELAYVKWVTSAIQTQLNDKITASSADTLTNKTLTAPKFADLWFIADANGNEMLVFDTTASAVNHWKMTNASWTSVILEADWETANINTVFRWKGNGRVTIGTSTSTAIVLAWDQPIEDSSNRELIKFTKATTAVNELTIGNAATWAWPSITATGDDTNININLTPKWTWVTKTTTLETTWGIELWHATDTTISRVSAWVIAVEWVNVVTTSSTDTLTNKRITPRVWTTTSSATPTINTDNVDAYSITALAVAITSFTTNLSWTPTDFQKLMIRIKDNGTARAITRWASFEAKWVALPTTTVANKVLTVWFIYDTVSAKRWCIASAQEA